MALKPSFHAKRHLKKCMLIEHRDFGLVALDYRITFHILNDLELE